MILVQFCAAVIAVWLTLVFMCRLIIDIRRLIQLLRLRLAASFLVSAQDAATHVCRQIRERAGAPPDCLFEYGGGAPDGFFKSPDHFLKSLYRDGVICMDCTKFIWAVIALGLPSSTTLNFCNRDLDEENCLLTPPSFTGMYRQVSDVLPGAVVAYIADKDTSLFDFWQRARVDYVGHWVIIYKGMTISMSCDGVVVATLDHWYDVIIDDRKREWPYLVYAGSRRKKQFMRHVHGALTHNSLKVYQ